MPTDCSNQALLSPVSDCVQSMGGVGRRSEDEKSEKALLSFLLIAAVGSISDQCVSMTTAPARPPSSRPPALSQLQ